ncbi:MAG TPA: PhzF family phenazine biosynthesis protein [Symbiobacteriaceae bacterium]|nr:PhzF family phenazine biosynthesis protein [Symbiobacteriaceae bacterium]
MAQLTYLWLDVFTDQPLTGNALCVVLDGTGLTDGQMQAVAKETNLSETTFVLPPTAPGASAAAPLAAYLHEHGLMPEGVTAFWYE